MSADPALKQKLDAGTFIAAPGVFDMMSLHIANEIGFDAIFASGYWLTASSLGLPDLGIATYTEMLDRIVPIAATSRAPVIADADTGYGGLLNLHRAVQGYERAGVTAFQLEDQIFPKKCGHTPDRPVIDTEEMQRKIRVVLETRSDENFLLVARTDARTDYGLDEAIARGCAYAEAGADLVFVEALCSVEEMARVCREVPGRLLVNMAEGGVTPILTVEELSAIGFAAAIFPAITPLAAMAAVRASLRSLKERGDSRPEGVERFSFAEMCQLLGFPEMRELEARWRQDPPGDGR